ncbi:hypothetical protein [Micromonospora sp. WMMD737]|uniref:hypothetical protein n=1 Tax=Micromonospora sp. WMMD737 TaxID=3404113 RepID=UPI003B92A4CC
MTEPNPSSLAVRLAARLRTRQWATDPERPELAARSAHDRHQFSADCAICARRVDEVAEVAVELVSAELAALLRSAAEGRREYARGAANQPDIAEVLDMQAATIDACAKVLLGDLGPLYDWLPSHRWTPEMTAHLYPERTAGGGAS